MGAHNLPLPALFDEDQCSSAMDRESLAAFGDSRKHVMSIYDTRHHSRIADSPLGSALQELRLSVLQDLRLARPEDWPVLEA